MRDILQCIYPAPPTHAPSQPHLATHPRAPTCGLWFMQHLAMPYVGSALSMSAAVYPTPSQHSGSCIWQETNICVLNAEAMCATIETNLREMTKISGKGSPMISNEARATNGNTTISIRKQPAPAGLPAHMCMPHCMTNPLAVATRTVATIWAPVPMYTC